MIQSIHLDTGPIRVGELRLLRAWGDEPLAVEIKCFVEKPPPSEFKHCPECGTFIVKNGQSIQIIPSHSVFANSEGSLEILIRDQSGDERQVSLQVISGINLMNLSMGNIPNSNPGGQSVLT